MKHIKHYLWLFSILAIMPGCLSQAHYNELMGNASDIKQLKTSDKQQDKKIEEIQNTLEKLQSSLRPEMQHSGVSVEKTTATSVKVSLPHAILFGSGSARIDTTGRSVLAKVVESLHGTSNDTPIRIVGYTDSMPVGDKLRDRYKDNWELSSARAAAVARVLIWGEEIDKQRIHVEGRADTDPVADNSTPEGREKNRRIEIFIGTPG